MNEVRYRTSEVARFAEVTLRQLQVWEEKRVAVASRSGRVRLYTPSQALFVIVVAAAEAAVGLGIIILIARNRQSLNVERVDLLKL